MCLYLSHTVYVCIAAVPERIPEKRALAEVSHPLLAVEDRRAVSQDTPLLGKRPVQIGSEPM